MNTEKVLVLLEQIFGDQETDLEWWKAHLKISLVGRNLTIEIEDINWQDGQEIKRAIADAV